MPADLDMTDVVTAPEFQSTFTVVRRPEVVSDRGRSNVPAPLTVPGVLGCVSPAGAGALQRLPDLDVSTNPISVITLYPLRQSAPGYKPDQILFDGNTYQVVDVEDYSNWGAGFVRATAALVDAQPV